MKKLKMTNRKKMHIDEIDIDVTLIHNLLSSQFPKWANHSINPIKSGGTQNAIFRLGQDMVVRLPRIKGAVKAIEKEYEWLPKLAPLLPLAIPKPLAKGEPDKNYPWNW